MQLAGFTRRDRLQIAVLGIVLIPFVLTVILGFERGSPAIVAFSSGLAIASVGFALAWGTESLQFLVSQTLALAVLAVVQVLPEYSVEVVLSYKGAVVDRGLLQYATAAMTGANRLLLGLGWPAVFIISRVASRRAGKPAGDLQLEGQQSVEIFFLALATVYSFVIVARESLGVVDAAVLLAIFAGYVFVATRQPAHGPERLVELEGPARAVASLKGAKRIGAMLAFLALGAFVIVYGAEPFVDNFLLLTRSLHLDQYEYFLIQWLTPVLTELPEAVTVVYWAAKTGKGALALANLVSSKVNQWTILISTIPIVYSIALGGFSTIALTQLQVTELLLTASQSLYGCVCLLDLRLSKIDAGVLLGLFMVQFLVPVLRIEVSVAYFALAALELARTKDRLEAPRYLRSLIRKR